MWNPYQRRLAPMPNPGPAAQVPIAACPPCPPGQQAFYNHGSRRWDCGRRVGLVPPAGAPVPPAITCDPGRSPYQPANGGWVVCGTPCNDNALQIQFAQGQQVPRLRPRRPLMRSMLRRW